MRLTEHFRTLAADYPLFNTQDFSICHLFVFSAFAPSQVISACSGKELQGFPAIESLFITPDFSEAGLAFKPQSRGAFNLSIKAGSYHHPLQDGEIMISERLPSLRNFAADYPFQKISLFLLLPHPFTCFCSRSISSKRALGTSSNLLSDLSLYYYKEARLFHAY